MNLRIFSLYFILYFVIYTRIVADEVEDEWYYGYEDEIDTLIDKVEEIHKEIDDQADKLNVKNINVNHRPFANLKTNRQVKVLKALANVDFINTTATQYGCMTEEMIAMARIDPNSTTIDSKIEKKEVEMPTSKKRLSMQEIQEEKARQQAEVIVRKDKLKPIYRLGGSCERLICESCNAIISELAMNIVKASTDESITTIDDVVKSLCTSRNIKTIYINLVSRVCEEIISSVSLIITLSIHI